MAAGMEGVSKGFLRKAGVAEPGTVKKHPGRDARSALGEEVNTQANRGRWPQSSWA